MDPDSNAQAARLAEPERRRGFSVRRQLRGLAPLGGLWSIGLVLLGLARVQTATSVPSLFLDPAHLAGEPWYTGAMSNFAILVWTTGVAFAAAGAWVARQVGRISAFRFLTVGAIATLVLVLDDVFALHAGPLRGALGDSKSAAQLLIVLPTVGWVVSFRDDIARTRFLYLIAAGSALGASLLIDLVIGVGGDDGLLVEDGFKLLGILAWSQYFAITSRDIARSAIRTAVDSAEGGSHETVDRPAHA